ncbi:MAG: tRNA pseudouridine(38-40) synthase TruA [Planctomycetota bacterium]|nr:MAG: tRNA pseudouridine(38-40) synthase TruA [Planctomycetota bacterium]
MNLRLTLAYDGTDFHGWQAQPHYRTVEATLAEAIRDMTGESPRLLSAGRTDAGVHALGQVASLETRSRIPAEKWRPALQMRLPEDLIVREVVEVPAIFHATYSAIGKRYRYLIHNSRTEELLLRRYSWRVPQPLDTDAMQLAADRLLGKHDFRSFETNYPNKATSVRTVRELRVFRTGPGSLLQGLAYHDPADRPTNMVAIEIEADGFLYNMVRTITGTLVNVGRGTWTPDDMERILTGQSRHLAGDTCPAKGLFLVRVDYPEREEDLRR